MGTGTGGGPLHIEMALPLQQCFQLFAGISSSSCSGCHLELIKAAVQRQLFKGRLFTPVTFLLSEQAPLP